MEVEKDNKSRLESETVSAAHGEMIKRERSVGATQHTLGFVFVFSVQHTFEFAVAVPLTLLPRRLVVLPNQQSKTVTHRRSYVGIDTNTPQAIKKPPPALRNTKGYDSKGKHLDFEGVRGQGALERWRWRTARAGESTDNKAQSKRRYPISSAQSKKRGTVPANQVLRKRWKRHRNTALVPVVLSSGTGDATANRRRRQETTRRGSRSDTSASRSNSSVHRRGRRKRGQRGRACAKKMTVS